MDPGSGGIITRLTTFACHLFPQMLPDGCERLCVCACARVGECGWVGVQELKHVCELKCLCANVCGHESVCVPLRVCVNGSDSVSPNV